MAKPPGHQTPDLYDQPSKKFDGDRMKSKNKSKGKRIPPRGKPSKPKALAPVTTDVSSLFKDK